MVLAVRCVAVYMRSEFLLGAKEKKTHNEYV